MRAPSPPFRLLSTLSLLLLLSLLSAAPAQAATTRIEAEAIPAPASCWGVTHWSALSGGSGRSCGWTANAPLRWTVNSNGSASVRLYGYRDELQRGYRVRVNGGAWNQGILSGPVAPSALFYSSSILPQGSHTFELEWLSHNGLTLDYYEVNSGESAPPPPPPPPPPPAPAPEPAPPPPAPASGRVEAEAIPTPVSCWGITHWGALSGGSARMCGWTANAPLRWTVSSGGSTVVHLHGYRDDRPRGYRVRIDGGGWSTGTLSGAANPSARFYSSPTLPQGSHTFELEWASENPFTFDYYEIVSGSSPPPPPPPPPPLPPPPPPPPPPPSGECAIQPADGQDAISAAIRACPDGTASAPVRVSFPAGQLYRLTNAIPVHGRNHLILDGNGSRFLKTDGNGDGEREPLWRLLEGSGVSLEDMSIDGGEPFGPLGITPGNQWNHGVLILGGRGHTVRDLSISNVYGDLVAVAPSGLYHYNDVTRGEIAREVLIKSIQGYNASRMCLGLTGGIGIRAEDNLFRHCRYGGIDLETDAPGEKLQEVKILRNTIDSASGSQEFSSWVPSIMVLGPAYAPPLADDIKNIEIRDNRILKAPATCYAPIQISEASPVRGPISNLSVSGNQVVTQGDGIRLYDVVGGSVSGNQISLSKSPHWCASPALPVRVGRSSGLTVGSNPATGY